MERSRLEAIAREKGGIWLGRLRYIARGCVAFELVDKITIRSPSPSYAVYGRTAFELADKRTTRSYAAHSGGRVGVGRATWPIHAALVLHSGIVSGLPDFAERDGDGWKPSLREDSE